MTNYPLYEKCFLAALTGFIARSKEGFEYKDVIEGAAGISKLAAQHLESLMNEPEPDDHEMHKKANFQALGGRKSPEEVAEEWTNEHWQKHVGEEAWTKEVTRLIRRDRGGRT